jgi:hypothetical protein
MAFISRAAGTAKGVTLPKGFVQRAHFARAVLQLDRASCGICR